MGFWGFMPRGEVCYKGPCAFKGYFRQPDQTKETIDKDGWVHTGDIGVFQQNGTMRIIDRKKNIFKLSQGEYIAPDKIEGKITQSIYIAQAFVYGDSLQSNVVAVVVPDQPVLEKWVGENSISGVYSEVIKSAQVSELLLGEIKKKCKESGCFGFEIPARVHVTGTLFSVENDLLTPTFKLKRNEAKAHFIHEIKAMYDGAKLQGE